MSEFGKNIARFGEIVSGVPFELYEAGRFVMDSKIKTMGGEGLEERTPEELEELSDFQKEIGRGLTAPILSALNVKEEDVYDEEGSVKDPETIPGAVGRFGTEVAPYVVGTTALMRAGTTAGLAATKVGARVVNPTVAVAATEQLLTDPEENLFNIAGDIFPEATKDTFVEYMSADPEDDEITNRMKMLVQDIGFIPLLERGLALGSTIRRLNAVRKAKGQKPLDVSNLNSEQQAEVVMDYLGTERDKFKNQRGFIKLGSGKIRDFLVGAREQAKRQDLAARKVDEDLPERTDLPTEKELKKETPEGAAQVQSQRTNPITRNLRRFLTSRGFYTPKAYNAFRDSQYAQRQSIKEAQNIAGRLDLAIRRLTDGIAEGAYPGLDMSVAKELPEQVQEALERDVSSIYQTPLGEGETRTDQLRDFFNSEYDFPEDVVEEVVNAREAIDSLSKKILGSPGFNPEVRESITENIGSYIRRSYRAYEDPVYNVSDEIKETNTVKLANQLMEEDPELSNTEAFSTATKMINGALANAGLGDEGLKKTIDFVASQRRVGQFKQKKDLPEPIRAVLGEIKNPSENIIISIAKASRIHEMNNFYREFNELGKSGKYLFTKKAFEKMTSEGTAPEGFVQIKGTNSILDGKYTSPEILEALERREEQVGFMQGEFGQDFAALKGLSQQAKTVYSHVTHIKNLLGATQSAIANGTNPFLGKGAESFKTLGNSLLRLGDKEFDAAYEKYLRLGLINTNVKVGEFRALLASGAEKEPSRLIKKLQSIKYADNIPGAKMVDRGVTSFTDGVTDAYMATDDFFKITTYLSELETLKKAFPDEAVDILEVQAAQTVQDVIPNYDKVPKGIKAIRDLPIGNFVSFPAEIARTSVNIVKQASKEITSGNAVLAGRGLQRLAGFAAINSGWYAASEATMDALGWTEEEKRAHNDLAEGTFNLDSPKLWKRDEEDGELYFVDTRFLDTYEYIKRPVLVAYDRIAQGQLRGDDLDEYLLRAVSGAGKALLEPYVEESMLTTVAGDMVAATLSGLDREGGAAGQEVGFEYQGDLGEHLGELINTFVPGSVTSIQRYLEAVEQKPTGRTGEPRNAKDELIVNLSGVRWTKYDTDSSLENAVIGYNSVNSNEALAPFKYDDDPEEYKKKYREQQEALYTAQQELFKRVNGHLTLEGRAVTQSKLREYGLKQDMIPSITLGQFYSPRPKGTALSLQIYEGLRKTNPDITLEEVDSYKDDLNVLHQELNGSSLYNVDYEFDLESGKYRQNKAKGGEVLNVPNVSKEPDQRIDKMTGLPYDQQAGTAFVDEEDPIRRLGFTGGGEVDPLQRLGFVAGSTAIARGLRELFTPTKTVGSKGSKRVVQDPDKPVVMTQTEELEETLDPRMGRAMEAETASSVMPAPGKFFDPEKSSYKEGLTRKAEDAGIEVDLEFGKYLKMGRELEDVSNKTFQNLYVTSRPSEKLSTFGQNNKSVARANEYDGTDLTIDQMKANYKKNTGVKNPPRVQTNLLQPDKFEIITDEGSKRLNNPIVSVEAPASRGGHFYALDYQLVGPVRMNVLTAKNKEGKVKSPNLRPETVGEVKLGNIIGTIKTSGKGKTHPLYDYIEVDGTPSLPEGVTKREKFNQGGFHMGYGSPEYSSFAEAAGYKYGSTTAEDIDTLERQVKQRYLTDKGIPQSKKEVVQQVKEEVLLRSGLPVTLAQRDAKDLIKERIASELSSRLPVDVGVQGDEYSLSKTFKDDEGSFLSLGASTNSGDPQFNLSFRKNFESGGKVLTALKRKKGV